jgi:hypothetical protein
MVFKTSLAIFLAAVVGTVFAGPVSVEETMNKASARAQVAPELNPSDRTFFLVPWFHEGGEYHGYGGYHGGYGEHGGYYPGGGYERPGYGGYGRPGYGGYGPPAYGGHGQPGHGGKGPKGY